MENTLNISCLTNSGKDEGYSNASFFISIKQFLKTNGIDMSIKELMDMALFEDKEIDIRRNLNNIDQLMNMLECLYTVTIRLSIHMNIKNTPGVINDPDHDQSTQMYFGSKLAQIFIDIYYKQETKHFELIVNIGQIHIVDTLGMLKKDFVLYNQKDLDPINDIDRFDNGGLKRPYHDPDQTTNYFQDYYETFLQTTKPTLYEKEKQLQKADKNNEVARNSRMCEYFKTAQNRVEILRYMKGDKRVLEPKVQATSLFIPPQPPSIVSSTTVKPQPPPIVLSTSVKPQPPSIVSSTTVKPQPPPAPPLPPVLISSSIKSSPVSSSQVSLFNKKFPDPILQTSLKPQPVPTKPQPVPTKPQIPTKPQPVPTKPQIPTKPQPVPTKPQPVPTKPQTVPTKPQPPVASTSVKKIPPPVKPRPVSPSSSPSPPPVKPRPVSPSSSPSPPPPPPPPPQSVKPQPVKPQPVSPEIVKLQTQLETLKNKKAQLEKEKEDAFQKRKNIKLGNLKDSPSSISRLRQSEEEEEEEDGTLLTTLEEKKALDFRKQMKGKISKIEEEIDELDEQISTLAKQMKYLKYKMKYLILVNNMDTN